MPGEDSEDTWDQVGVRRHIPGEDTSRSEDTWASEDIVRAPSPCQGTYYWSEAMCVRKDNCRRQVWRRHASSRRHVGGRRRFPKTGRAKTRVVAKTHGRAKTLPEDRSGEDTRRREDTPGREDTWAKTPREDRSGEIVAKTRGRHIRRRQPQPREAVF